MLSQNTEFNSRGLQRYYCLLVYADLSGRLHIAVEREFAAEALHDVAQHAGIVRQGIGVEGRHYAASPEVVNTYRHVTNQ